MFTTCQRDRFRVRRLPSGNMAKWNMRVISREPFRKAAIEFRQFAGAITDVYKALKTGDFKDPDELKKAFPSLDKMKYQDRWWVIDIRGGNLRLMMKVDFTTQTVYVKHITDHAEYDRLVMYYRSNKQ